MRLSDLRYLLAYLVPACLATGLALRGPWVWLTPGFVFGLVPLLELLWPPRPAVGLAPATAGAPTTRFSTGFSTSACPCTWACWAGFWPCFRGPRSRGPKWVGWC